MLQYRQNPPSCRNTDAFHMAPRASMAAAQPVACRTRCASPYENTSPLAMTGVPGSESTTWWARGTERSQGQSHTVARLLPDRACLLRRHPACQFGPPALARLASAKPRTRQPWLLHTGMRPHNPNSAHIPRPSAHPYHAQPPSMPRPSALLPPYAPSLPAPAAAAAHGTMLPQSYHPNAHPASQTPRSSTGCPALQLQASALRRDLAGGQALPPSPAHLLYPLPACGLPRTLLRGAAVHRQRTHPAGRQAPGQLHRAPGVVWGSRGRQRLAARSQNPAQQCCLWGRTGKSNN